MTLVVLGILFAGEIRVSKRALVLWLAYVLCGLFSIDRYGTLFGQYGHWSSGLWAASIYLCLTGERNAASWIRRAGVLLAVFAIYERATGMPRAISTIGSPVILGMILAMCFPHSGWFSPVIAAGLWATGSRGAWVAAAATLIPTRLRAWVVVPLIVATFWLPGEKDKARIEVWKTAVLSGLEYPVLGSGPDTFYSQFRLHRTLEFNAAMKKVTGLQSYAHNDILEAFATCGAVGLLFWIAFTLPMLKSLPLLALWINMKFNPASFEVLAVAALFVGQYEYENGGSLISLKPHALILVSLPILTLLWYGETVGPVLPVKDQIKAQFLKGYANPRVALDLVKLHPKDPEVHYVRSAVSAALGNVRLAKLEIDAAAALDPTFEPVQIKRRDLTNLR